MISSQINLENNDDDTIYKIKKDLESAERNYYSSQTKDVSLSISPHYKSLIQAKREKLLRENSPRLRSKKSFESNIKKENNEENDFQNVVEKPLETTIPMDDDHEEHFRRIIEKFSIKNSEDLSKKADDQTDDIQETLADLRAELEVIKLSQQQEINDLRNSYQSEIQTIKKYHLEQMDELKKTHILSIKNLEHSHREQMQELQGSLIEKKSQISSLNVQLEEQQQRITIMEQKLLQLTTEIKPSSKKSDVIFTPENQITETPSRYQRSSSVPKFPQSSITRQNINQRLLFDYNARLKRPSSKSTLVQQHNEDLDDTEYLFKNEPHKTVSEDNIFQKSFN